MKLPSELQDSVQSNLKLAFLAEGFFQTLLYEITYNLLYMNSWSELSSLLLS